MDKKVKLMHIGIGKNMHRKWRQKLKALVKTRFANKVIMFKKTLKFKQIILLCYGRQNTPILKQRIMKAQMWVITKIIIQCLNPMVITGVLN